MYIRRYGNGVANAGIDVRLFFEQLPSFLLIVPAPSRGIHSLRHGGERRDGGCRYRPAWEVEDALLRGR